MNNNTQDQNEAVINHLQSKIAELKAEAKLQANLLTDLSEKAYSKVIKSVYTVWVGGCEVNEDYLTLRDAKDMEAEYLNDGYDDVVIEELVLSTK
jgi:hypothetical protein|tara:strand:+ start:7949 stop:8233 length:285 start_codon:yes stop_codon:yes gene_type:complete